MGRGGDQIPFLDKGYPAVRVTVAVEDYEHQHEDLRTENGIEYGDTVDELDFDYLTRASQLNVRALHRLAMAPMPPRVSADAAVRVDTQVDFTVPEGTTDIRLFKRRTDEAYWSDDLGEGGVPSRLHIAGSLTDTGGGDKASVVVPYRGDDWLFGAAACNGDYCSPVSSAVPGGAFAPVDRGEDK